MLDVGGSVSSTMVMVTMMTVVMQREIVKYTYKEFGLENCMY